MSDSNNEKDPPDPPKDNPPDPSAVEDIPPQVLEDESEWVKEQQKRVREDNPDLADATDELNELVRKKKS